DSGSGKSLYVFNVHLDHESQRSREQSALLLQERIQNVETGTPIIVLGDFNTGEQNLTVRIIQGEDALTDNLSPRRTKFADTYRLIHPRAVEVGTFHAFSGERTGEKIDYIFVSPGVTVLEAEILHFKVDGRYPSDHFPVTARITF
ncbi:MAG: endonuclease/exonuclease/phosphatase family protein, partial [Bacteroidota bacterium]